MTSASWLMVVDLDLDPAIEADWNEWYDDVHLPEIASCPGFLRGTRYIAPEADEDGRRRHLTIYELGGPDAMQTAELAERRGLGPFADRATARTRLYERHLTYEAGDRA